MSNVLVTGGQGFIGRHVVSSLLDLGYHVTVVDYKSNLPCAAHIFYPQECSAFFAQRLIQFDAWNLKDLLGEKIQYDLVIHLADIPRVGISLVAPAQVIENNVNATLGALEYCRKSNTPLINISSGSAVWADCDKNPYALSKKMCEQMVTTYRETFGVKASNVRLFSVYGPGETHYNVHTTLIRKCKTAIQEGNTLPVYGDGSHIRDYTHVLDVVQALMQIVNDALYDRLNSRYEVGAGEESISVNDIVAAFSVAGLKHEYMSARAGDPPLTRANTALCPENWTPKIHVLDHIKNWIRMGCPND